MTAILLYGVKSDNFSTIWYIWNLSNRFFGHSFFLINFPFGYSLRKDPLSFVTTLPTTWLASRTGEVSAFNFMLFLSFILSGLFTFLLIRFLTRQTAPAIVCGLAYMLLPYHTAISQYHFSLAHVEVFPLFLLTLMWFLKKPRWYTGTSILLAQFLSFSIEPHYGLFNFLVLLTFLVVYLPYRGKQGWALPTLKRLGEVVTLSLLAAATGIPRFLTVIQSSKEVTLGKPFTQLYAYSARIWDYFIPPAHHPLLGQFTKGFIEAHIHNSYVHEQTLYLGITVVILAAFGTRWLWHSRVPEHRFLGVFLPLVAVGASLFSMPPTVNVFGLVLPMPGYFLWHLLPMFRVYARFGVVVATAAIVLAGVGMAWLLEMVQAKRTIATLLGILILFEYLPTIHFVDLSTSPAVYQWLADQEEVKAIAEYPLCWPPEKVGEHLNLWDLYEYMVWQRVHKKPLFNGEPQKLLDMAMKLQLANLSGPNVPARLAWLGVTHIVVHKDKVPPKALRGLQANNSVEKVYEDEEAAVYKIIGDISFFSPQSFRYPEDVQTEKVEGGLELRLVPSESLRNREALIVYGPYLALYTGRYRATFLITPLTADTATIRVVVVADGGRKVLASQGIKLGTEDTATLDFWTDGDPDVEFRIYAHGVDLVFKGVELRQIERGTYKG